MEAFILKTLKRIRKEAPRRLKDLRNICDELIVSLTELDKGGGSSESNADQYFGPLQMACESRMPRLMDIALDGLHYLMEHGYLRGNKRIDGGQENDSEDAAGKQIQRRILMDLVIEVVSNCSDEYDDNVQLQVIKALLTAVTSVYCEVHEASLLLAVRSCFHIHLISKNQVNKTTAKAALTQMLSVVNQRMETFDARSKAETEAAFSAMSPEEESGAVGPNSDESGREFVDGEHEPDEETDAKAATSSLSFPSIMHKDAFLIFRALCKLSMKGLHDESGLQSSDPIALQNKILSLELILHVLQRSGPAFRSGEKFIYAIRHYLCVSLLSNCTSQVNQVTGLSLQIFVSLMDGFKDHLKSELEVFVTNIFLKILESENSSFDHKMRVLEVFHIICTESSAMVEVFINYDCDLEAIDLFRRIVDGFAKIAKNPSLSASNRGTDFMTSVSATSKRIASEEQNLRVKGLEGLVIVLRSLLRSANLWQGIGELGHISAVVESEQVEGASSEEKVANIDSVDEDAGEDADQNFAVEVFDRKQRKQEELETGILKFNLSPKKGLAYLVALNHLEMTPSSVANFLRVYQDRLDKTAVGDYLGREREYENGFCIKVLHEYVDAMDFAGMAFDMAIRCFLAGFRLPGEAQKIDRLMEKFAERYYLQNRDTFASADMAFILAFSTIMLQTNLHNPAIREDKRMTKDQFIKQNKGISSDGELSDEMLIEIYDRIAAEPISITQNDKFKSKAEPTAAFTVFPLSFDKRRKDAFNNERKEMVRASEAMFKQKMGRGSSMYVRKVNTRSDDACSKPMFEIVWAPILGVLSQLLEMYDDAPIVDLCLTCFQYSIRLACRLDFPVARNTFVNALAKFTTLDSVREMQSKNIDSIRSLLDIALYEGDYLDESWSQVLQCISQLARLQLFANGLHSDDMFFSDTASVASTDSGSARGSRKSRVQSEKAGGTSSLSLAIGVNVDQFAKLFSGPSRADTMRQVEECNAELVTREINPDSIVRIYVNSQMLSVSSVYHFVKSLVEVSALEITASSTMTSLRGKDSSGDPTTPRVFSLQKLVEVADFNMGIRARLAWANIWNLLAEHFTAVGINDNHALAMFAIDSLKQLSIKFLQKEELSNFNFQRLFLKPFEVIITRSKYPEIKDLVLRCIDIMISSCANNIRSGWKSIFAIFEVAANQEMLEIANIAFDITERLMTQQFELLIFDFVELMNCLVAFVASQHTSLSLKALSHLSKCADHLANGSISPALDMVETDVAAPATSETQIDEDASVFRLWWPLLLGLSGRVGDHRLAVRVRALATLGIVLRNYGHLFSPQTWSVIFKGVLFPMIDSAKTDATVQPQSAWPAENPASSSNNQSWIGTMALSVFSVCLELFNKFKDKAKEVPLLPDLMTMIEGCICQETETLARMALHVYNELLVGLSNSTASGATDCLDLDTANLACGRLSSIITRNLCLDFGEIGFLELSDDAPSSVSNLLPECPLTNRRHEKGGSLRAAPAGPTADDIGVQVSTPYATGKTEQILPADSHLGVPTRFRIELCWGASLYSCESFPPLHAIPTTTDRVVAGPRLTEEQMWRELSSAAMTSMVISLDSISCAKAVLFAQFSSWRLEHFTSILAALEASHWHAKSFNANFAIRNQLRKRGFMPVKDSVIVLPHLLEQEVQSAAVIVDTTLLMYSFGKLEASAEAVVGSNSLPSRVQPHAFESFAEPWVHRIGSLVLRRFIALDFESHSPSASPVAGMFTQQHKEAYIPCVIAILQGIVGFSKAQFARNKVWVVSLLSELVLCDDKEVRLCVSQVYITHVNPLLC